MKLQSSSQAGQDVFVYEVTGQRKDGFFIDAGCYNLCMGNNSYALERIGWRGLLVDVQPDEPNIPKRTSPFIEGDATKLDWLEAIATAGLPRHITYGSFDIDDATPDLIDVFPLDSVTFDVLTVEHDFYRLGDGPKKRIAKRLKDLGYVTICDDVKISIPGYKIDGAFETWLVSPQLEQAASRFKSKGRYWQDILKETL